jgi:hypothetical protein
VIGDESESFVGARLDLRGGPKGGAALLAFMADAGLGGGGADALAAGAGATLCGREGGGGGIAGLGASSPAYIRHEKAVV